MKNWIRELEICGDVTFSFEDVCRRFSHLDAHVVSNALTRLRKKKLLYSPHRGFFVIVPIRYADTGVVPPTYYLDRLMRYLHRSYYVSLFSAASFFGAAHQRAMKTSVMLQLPRSTMTPGQNDMIQWTYRQNVPERFLLSRNTEIGIVKYSNADLTAIDLLHFEANAGGLSTVATILSELCEETSFAAAAEGVFSTCTSADIQRLGFIYEDILGASAQADVIHREWRKRFASPHRARLSPRKESRPEDGFNRRWLLEINTDIEVDETWT